ncbi:MAG: class I SAM-dependent methyltransferase [Leifsonia sp.]|uniref:class I SAM-dependent methyltransferase n=1 Tax=Leifsonia sp. TaxID=1870902 RepID=UPI003F80440D
MSDEHLRAVRARFDDRAAEYDDSSMHRALAAEVAAFAEVRPGSDVLDVATGTGLVLRSLRDARAGARLTGVDLSPGMLAVARERLPEATFVEADATSLPLPDASVDVVICVTGLHLFPDPAAAIAEWARVLRPEGRAVTATFGRMDPAEHGGRHGAPQPPSYPTHHELFETPELLAAAVAPAGLFLARHAWWTSGADRILLAELTR